MPVRTIGSWALWRERRRAIALVIAVEAVATTLPAISWSPIRRSDIDLALLLASLSVTYSVFVVGWEKAHRLLLFERAPAMTPDVLAVWCFAAALLLPPGLAAAVTAVAAIGDLPSYNPAGTRPLYRYVYSAFGSVLAATAASWIFRHQWPLGEALAAAATTWLLIGAGAMVLAMCASGQPAAVRTMLHLDSYRLELVTMAVAVAEYAAYRASLPLLIWLSLPAAVGIQRYFTSKELRTRIVAAAPMDQDTWLHVAKVIVAASETVTVLRIDTADRLSAQTVAMLQCGCDAIGTYADGGLAVLLLDCPPPQGDALARRLRTAMDLHKVECTIAAVSKPRDGRTLADLLAVSEAELVLSREAARRPTDSV